MPVFQLEASADMSRVNELVGRLRERDPDVRVTVTDILTKACAAALMRHREVNAQYLDDAILRFPTANVGIAVAAPQGLVVPVIRAAERLRLAEIAAVRGDLVSRAREAKLRPGRPAGRDLHDLEPRHVQRRALHGRAQSTPGCDPRGRSDRRPSGARGRRGGRAADGHARDATFDHRAVDGAPAAAFLEAVKEFARGARPGAVNVWYRVRDLDAARAFYAGVLGFEQTFSDDEGRWARLKRDDMEIALWESTGDEGGVASINVPDVRAEADRLRAAGIEVGVIVELHGQVRIVDVFDPDGNRIQLTEEVQ